MLTLVFRRLEAAAGPCKDLDSVAEETATLLADLIQAQVVTTVTPVLSANGQLPVARHMRWHSYGTRDRLVLETTWHLAEGFMVFDAVRAAVDYHRFAAVWAICQQAASAGYGWAGAWWDGEDDPVLDNLWFHDANELFEMEDENPPMPPMGRQELPGGLVLEWLHPSVRIMKRLVYFAEDCKIDWESLIIEDLMTDTATTYLELRDGRNTVALARIIRETYLPGMEGYDPRSPRPPVEFEIESFEVHPDHQGKGYGNILVSEVQRLRRPMSTLDTYRRAEKFWERMGFVRNPRRSSREDSNIFEWTPPMGPAAKSMTEEETE
ncbi:MAG TPA: GNAT family N-acetyltransferase [Symbiobacteriaceae bacterium]|jgi:GNAT superfamily N-acetyltransferase|nr:GNAT family N-acetyltransferase [Symbiobacteriaceae bacterium]